MDETIAPWGFLIGGAVFCVVAVFMIDHADATGDRVLGYIAGWIGFVLTVAGAAALGVGSDRR